MATIPHASSPSYSAFIPAALDEHGLSPREFRVYCHLARRAGNGECFASAASIARVTRINVKTVRACLRVLLGLNLITTEKRTGQTNLHRLIDSAHWQPYPNQYPTQSDTQVSKWVDPLPNPIPTHPTQSDTPKGSPSEGSTIEGVIYSLDFPLTLNTPTFKAAFRDWAEYLTSKKKGKKSSFKKTFQFQLDRKLAGLPEADAIEWIHNAIERGWQGLFPPTKQATQKQTKSDGPKDHGKW